MNAILEVILNVRRAQKTVRRVGLLKALREVELALDVTDAALDAVEHADFLNKITTQSAAYGFEIGRGAPLKEMVDVSPDNPFLDPNWRAHVANS